MVFAKVAKLRAINDIKMYKIVENQIYMCNIQTVVIYVGGSFEEKLFMFNIYFFVRSLLLTYLITLSLEKEIYYCVRNLEFFA